MYLSEDINDILNNDENAALEFKEARGNFSNKDRSDYCAALANMGGGKLLLGVSDQKKVVGTSVYSGTINRIPQEVYKDIGITINIFEVQHPDGRVIIFEVPPRPVGHRVRSNGNYMYPIRRGESLGEMDDTMTKEILNEIQPDFSAGIVEDLSMHDLDEKAIENFRKRRLEKTGNHNIQTDNIKKILSDAELMRGEKLTYAALILLGKSEKISQHLPQAEIIFEWRNNPNQIHHDFRTSWRKPYFAVYDEIWATINARNIRTPYQEGFIQQEVFAFDEKACREAVNNAVAHRNYSVAGQSIIVHASSEYFSVISPGGFPKNITPENILTAVPHWRNRLIAESFEKTSLVERSGQGIDTIFETSLRQGKGLPNFTGTTKDTVKINIPAQVRDIQFVKFLEKITNEKQIILSFDEIYELEKLRHEQQRSSLQHKEKFLKLGIIEKIGKKRGTQYVLSHKYYEHSGKSGIHTRLVGTSREQKKLLIINHLKRFQKGTSSDFQAALEINQVAVKNLLSDLKKEGKIKHVGSKRSGYWILI